MVSNNLTAAMIGLAQNETTTSSPSFDHRRFGGGGSEMAVSNNVMAIDGQPKPPTTALMGDAGEDFSIDDFELASKGLQYCLTVLYSVTAGLALFGNVISIAVLMRGKRSSRDLRLFLVNLSLSDILMSIFSIPFTYTDFVMGRWMFHPHLCPVVQSIQIVSVFVSIYTLTTIGIDRYIAIMKPFMVNFWNKSFAPIIVMLTWLAGGILGLVIWFYSYAEPFTINNVTYYDCRESWQTKEQEQVYTIGLFLFVFALPLLCLMFFYGSICHKLWYHSMPGNANAARDNAQYLAKRKVIKMLITIVVLFAICWFPSHLFHLVRVFREDWLMKFSGNDASNPSYMVIVIVSHWLSMAHSFVNPIIYSFMSDNFKADVKYMLQRMINYNGNRPNGHHRNQQLRNQMTNVFGLPDDDDDDDHHHGNGIEGSEIVATTTANNHHRPTEFSTDTKIELLILQQQQQQQQLGTNSEHQHQYHQHVQSVGPENSSMKSIINLPRQERTTMKNKKKKKKKGEFEDDGGLEEEQQPPQTTSFIITNNTTI